MINIETNRLKITALAYPQLYIWQQKGRNELEKTLNLNLSNWEVDSLYEAETKDAIDNFWIPQTILNSEKYEWFTNWEIILKSENISIGGIGFGGYPANGQTPVGYLIDKKYQNQGFATEALGALVNWAFQNKMLNTILADTPKDNIGSQKTLKKNGFEITGEGLAEHTVTMQVYHWAKPRPV